MNISQPDMTDFERTMYRSPLGKTLSELALSTITYLGAIGIGYAAAGPIESVQRPREHNSPVEREDTRKRTIYHGLELAA